MFNWIKNLYKIVPRTATAKEEALREYFVSIFDKDAWSIVNGIIYIAGSFYKPNLLPAFPLSSTVIEVPSIFYDDIMCKFIESATRKALKGIDNGSK